MSLLDTESPVSVARSKIHTAAVTHSADSNGKTVATWQRMPHPAVQPLVRRELLPLWTFLIVLVVITYFVIRVLSQLQTNVNAERQQTRDLAAKIAAVADRQEGVQAKISQVQSSNGRVLGVVGDLGRRMSKIDTSDRELTGDLKALGTRLRLLEHQQRVRASLVPVKPAIPETVPQAVPAALPQVAGSGHIHQFLTNITPPKAVEVKQVGGEDNVWAVSKNGTMMVVRPFAMSPLGTWVHSSTDNRDYILTPSGGWMAGSALP